MNAETRGPGHRLTERYTLVRVLGRGGMATVWEAVNEAGHRVALKLLHHTLSHNQDNVSRFFLEARNATRVAHPGIVRVLDTGQTEDGTPFLVMEHLEGISLEALLERHGAFTPAQAVSVLAPMLDALAAAHAAGVIHRDLKPGNVFIALGAKPAVKILDFGISRAITNETRLTQTGMLFGTPAYMAPEQIEGTKDAGPAADLYAVGAIAFELVTGAPPYTAASALALAALVVSKPPAPLASVKPDVPPAFAAVVDATLRRAPNERPPDALTLKRALAAAVAPDLQWPFERTAQLVHGSAAADAQPRLPKPAPAPAGAEITLAVLHERLLASERKLPPAIAVRIVHDVLFNPASPPTFGLSHLRVAANGVVHAVAGTPKRLRFASSVQSTTPPEAWGGSPGALSSQFSAAAVLVQLLTGKAAFEALDDGALEQQVRSGAPSNLLAELPVSLRAPVQRMLSADPLQRYPDAGSCATELAAPFKTAPLYSRATEELAVLVRLTSQTALPTTRTTAAPAPEKTAGGVRPLVVLVALLALGIVAWKLRAPAQVLVEHEDGTLELMNADAFDASTRVAPALVALSSDYTVQTTPPGAALWVDGQFRGNAPGTLSLEGNGKTSLHVELPAHEPLEVPLEPDGQPHPLTLRLTRAPDVTLAWATFELREDDTLWLDGVLMARGRIKLPVEAGKSHSWEVERGGARLTQRPFALSTGEEKFLRVDP